MIIEQSFQNFVGLNNISYYLSRSQKSGSNSTGVVLIGGSLMRLQSGHDCAWCIVKALSPIYSPLIHHVAWKDRNSKEPESLHASGISSCFCTLCLRGLSTLASDFLHGASKGACLEREIQEKAVLHFMSQAWKSHSVMSTYSIGRGSSKSLLHPTHGETSTLDHKSMRDEI